MTTTAARARLHLGYCLLGFGAASATPAGALLSRGVGTLLGLAGYRYGFRLT